MSLKTMLAEVAAYYEITPEDLRSRDQHHAIAHPRQAFMWLARQARWADGRVRYSYPQIGAFLDMDQSTARHGALAHAARLKRLTGYPPIDPQATPQCVDGLLFTIADAEKQRTIAA